MVTGATGFLGSNVCDRLLSLGAEVVGVARHVTQEQTATMRWIESDLRNLDATHTLVAKTRPDEIIHLAGQTIASQDHQLIVPTLHDNLMATVNLLLAARDAGCHRIVVTGSLEEPTAGAPDAVPFSPYGASKWATVMYARMFYHLYGCPVAIVRPFMTYGPRQRETKLIPHVVLSLLRGEAPKIFNGERKVDWIYVDDVVEGVLASARVPKLEGRIIDLGSGTLTTIRWIVEELADILGSRKRPIIESGISASADAPRVADIAGTEVLLGWKPSTPLGIGLRQTVEWYRNSLDSSSRLDRAVPY